MDIGVEPDPLDPAFGRDQRITVEAVTSRAIVRLEIAVLNELRVTAAIPRVIYLLEKDALHPRIGGHSRGSHVDVDVHSFRLAHQAHWRWREPTRQYRRAPAESRELACLEILASTRVKPRSMTLGAFCVLNGGRAVRRCWLVTWRHRRGLFKQLLPGKLARRGPLTRPTIRTTRAAAVEPSEMAAPTR